MASRSDAVARHLTQANPRPSVLPNATSDLAPDTVPASATQQLLSEATPSCITTTHQWLRTILLLLMPVQLFMQTLQRCLTAFFQCILTMHEHVMEIHQCVKPIERGAKVAQLWIKTLQKCMKMRLQSSENVSATS